MNILQIDGRIIYLIGNQLYRCMILFAVIFM